MEKYLDTVAELGVAPNVGTLVGHGTVRFEVLGTSDRAPDEAELDRMADLVTESLEGGALGFSTGLVYHPQLNASTHEIRTLAARLSPSGRLFVAHIRSEGRWLWEAFNEFIDVGAEAGVPIHLSHTKVAGKTQQRKASRLLHLVEAARERGVDITADQYPYAAGSSPLSSFLPPRVHADDSRGVLNHLRDEDSCERIRHDIEGWRIDGWENYGRQAGGGNVTLASVSSDSNAEFEGMTLAAIASETDPPVEVVCDVLIEENLEASTIECGMAELDVRELMAHSVVAVVTDGLFGGRPHPGRTVPTRGCWATTSARRTTSTSTSPRRFGR